MKQEIKYYQWQCDKCGKKAITTALKLHVVQLPEKWTRTLIHDCGSTGYSTHQDLCDGCMVQ